MFNYQNNSGTCECCGSSPPITTPLFTGVVAVATSGWIETVGDNCVICNDGSGNFTTLTCLDGSMSSWVPGATEPGFTSDNTNCYLTGSFSMSESDPDSTSLTNAPGDGIVAINDPCSVATYNGTPTTDGQASRSDIKMPAGTYYLITASMKLCSHTTVSPLCSSFDATLTFLTCVSELVTSGTVISVPVPSGDTGCSDMTLVPPFGCSTGLATFFAFDDGSDPFTMSDVVSTIIDYYDFEWASFTVNYVSPCTAP